jgi:peptidyl-prolyl cis-trans isomerase C
MMPWPLDSKEDSVGNRILTLAKEPLVQFLLIGTCIYGLYALYGTPAEDITESTITVSAARVESFIGQWEKRWNRPPTRQELDGLIDTYVREEILYRQAVAMGLDEDDPVTRRRMAQKLEFLTNDLALFKEPTRADLEQYFESHQERYREADLITFNQVFLDPDARDESTLDDAARLLAELQASSDPDEAAQGAGDRLMSQSYYRQASQIDVHKQLGSGFAEAVMELEPGQWHGPVLSGYGVHLVYVHEVRHAPPAALEDVRQRVLEDWQAEQQEKFNAEFYASLASRYDIVIAEPPDGSVLEEARENPVP